MTCKYMYRAVGAVAIKMDGSEHPIPDDKAPILCGWAIEAPEGPSLVGAPVWIQRIALEGAHVRDGDCEKCAACKEDA